MARILQSTPLITVTKCTVLMIKNIKGTCPTISVKYPIFRDNKRPVKKKKRLLMESCYFIRFFGL
jgi:hypothetical protein